MKAIKFIIQLIKEISGGTFSFLLGLYYKIINTVSSLFVVSVSFYSALFFLGVFDRHPNITFQNIVVLTFFLFWMTYKSGKAYYNYIMQYPHEDNLKIIPKTTDEYKIVKKKCKELHIDMPHLFYQEDGNGRKDLPLENVNAFAWFNSVIISGFNNLNYEAKEFILGHELGHIFKQHKVSSHLEKVLEDWFYMIEDLKDNILNLNLWKVFTFFVGFIKDFVFSTVKLIMAIVSFNILEVVDLMNNWLFQLIFITFFYQFYCFTDDIIQNKTWIDFLNLIPFYLSINLGKMVLKWMSRQQEFACDAFSLTIEEDDESIKRVLKGGEDTFKLFYNDKLNTWYQKYIGVIYDSHPNPKSRINKLNYRAKSFYLDFGMMFLRHSIVCMVLFFGFQTMNKYEINIFTHPKVKKLYYQIEKDVKKYIPKKSAREKRLLELKMKRKNRR